MKMYAALRDVDYTTRSDGIKCCGACAFLNTGGNAITCDRIDPPARVIPQGICKLFKMLGEKDAE